MKFKNVPVYFAELYLGTHRSNHIDPGANVEFGHLKSYVTNKIFLRRPCALLYVGINTYGLQGAVLSF